MKKVKITKVPNMAWGGRVFNQVAPNALPYQTDEDMMHYNDTLQPVDREEANLEAEKDEEVVMPNYKGMSAKFRVGGKRHFEGGTPLNLPDDSFVFSDTRAMKIKDPKILKAFGKPEKAGGYTPAELAKGYDINKYRKILDDPMSDAIQKKTAEEMIGNYNVLLGKLALAQESKKGFPQGIPYIAQPYLMINNINPEDILPMPEEQGMQAPQQQMQMTKYGGLKKSKYQPGGATLSERENEAANKVYDRMTSGIPTDGYDEFLQAYGKEFRAPYLSSAANARTMADGADTFTYANGVSDPGSYANWVNNQLGRQAVMPLQKSFAGPYDLVGRTPNWKNLPDQMDISEPYVDSGIDYRTLTPNNPKNYLSVPEPELAYGGTPKGKKVRIKQLPQAQVGFQAPWQKTLDMVNPKNYPINPATNKAEYKPQPVSADPNAGQIIPPGSHFSDTTKDPLLKDITGKQVYAGIEMAKGIGTNLINANAANQGDSMLAYRTMEDTMTGIPTDKGTFDPLNKNNLPYKNDIAIKDQGTYSGKYGGNLPQGQIGQQIVSNIPGVAPVNPMYHPFNDPLTQNIASYRDPKTLPAANNLMIQNALDQQAQAAAVATSLQNQIDQSAKSTNAKNSAASQNTSTSSGRGDLISFNQQFWDEYSGLGQSGAFVYDLPGINFQDPKERERREIQSRIGKDPNIYGDLEWNKGQEWADFTRRHQWYLKDHPNFNPTDNAQVKDFQNEYCKKAASYGMKSCYFVQGAGKGVDIDGKFGEHTWSAPGFNKPQEKSTTRKENKGQEDIKPVDVKQKPPYTPFEYYPQDVLNLMTAMGAKIPDPQTFYSNLAWQAYSPAYIKEDYSPIMEAANIATQGIGAYGSRQSADASYSGIQGKAARQAADHNLQVANLNVGIYNDAEKFNAQTREKNYMYNQMQKQQNFDTEQAYAADRIKAKNEKRANVAALYNQMLTNAVDTYNLNTMNPNFKVLPGTGGMIDIINYDVMKPNKDANVSARLKEYEALRADGYSHDEAIDIIGRQTGKASYSQQQYPYSNPYDYMTGLNYYEG